MTLPFARLLLSFSLRLLTSAAVLLPLSATAADIAVIHDPQPLNLIWPEQTAPAAPGNKQRPQGGTFTQAIARFPDNVRRTGPGTPHSLSRVLNDLQLPLMFRDNKGEWSAALASRWLLQGNRLYIELQPQARWSDKIAVTTDDIEFTLAFLQSPDTGSDWQRKRLEELVSDLIIFSDHQFAFVLKETSESALEELASLRPFAAHVLRNRRHWPENFDWYPEPTTGPYHLTQINAGESLVFSRTSDWWASRMPAFQGRFNLERIVLRVPDGSSEAALFNRGELDVMQLCPTCRQQQQEMAALSLLRKFSLYESGPVSGGANGLLINGRSGPLSSRSVRDQLIHALDLPEAISALTSLAPAGGFMAQSQNESFNVRASTGNADLPDTLTLSYTNASDLPLLEHLVANARGHDVHIHLLRLSAQEMTAKLGLGLYDLVWLSFAEPLTAASLVSLFTPDTGSLYIANPGFPPSLVSRASEQNGMLLEHELMMQSLLIPGYRQRTSTTAVWEWIKTPSARETPIISAFDVRYGGNFWLDRKARADILAQPERATTLPSGDRQP